MNLNDSTSPSESSGEKMGGQSGMDSPLYAVSTPEFISFDIAKRGYAICSDCKYRFAGCPIIQKNINPELEYQKHFYGVDSILQCKCVSVKKHGGFGLEFNVHNEEIILDCKDVWNGDPRQQVEKWKKDNGVR